MRRAALAALCCAAAGAGIAGCGGGSGPVAAGLQGDADAQAAAGKSLAWVKAPKAYDVPELPNDRVLQAELRNDSGKPIDLRVDQVDVRDTDGKPLRISVRFAQAFGHALYGPGGPPAPLEASRYDQARLGERVTLPSGETQPITLAWRERKGVAAKSVKVSGHELPLPR